MAVGDLVINGASLLASPVPPLKGTVVNVPGANTSDVMWENGRFAAAVDDASLGLIFDPIDVSAEFSFMLGRYVQIDDWPIQASGYPNATPKSPGASGVVLAAYGVGSIGDQAPSTGVLEVEVLNGAGVLIVQAPLGGQAPVTALGRRDVY